MSKLKSKQTRKPMKYETIPTINGMYLSDLLEMSLSVPSFLAQNNMIAMGSMDAKISETTSNVMNLLKLNPPPLNESIMQIIKNNGMQMIGGLVNV